MNISIFTPDCLFKPKNGHLRFYFLLYQELTIHFHVFHIPSLDATIQANRKLVSATLKIKCLGCGHFA